jgi:hypothetical protein
VLIVCEGTKTEPKYFIRLREIYRLSSANVHVTPAGGSDPMSIVAHAEQHQDDFDRIYCVFDRNSHQNYDEALQRIVELRAAGHEKFVATTSWPCFEFWILLHFRYSSAAFVDSGGKSPCDNVIINLKSHIPAYTKGHATIFDDLNPHIQVALEHANRLARDNAKTGSDNPSTKVHELVKYLLELKTPNV